MIGDELYYLAFDNISGINFNITASHKGILKIHFNVSKELKDKNTTVLHPDDPFMFGIFNQLKEYFKRERKKFDVPLDIRGSDFQKKVWKELLLIPYGRTVSYKYIAEKLGDVKTIRAVGKANGMNPIPVIIPCHRVINSNGSLGGYSGGLSIKEKLLKIEGSLDMDLFQ